MQHFVEVYSREIEILKFFWDPDLVTRGTDVPHSLIVAKAEVIPL